jgi:hypothetical protein
MKTFLDWSAYDTYGIGDAYSGIPATGLRRRAFSRHPSHSVQRLKEVDRPLQGEIGGRGIVIGQGRIEEIVPDAVIAIDLQRRRSRALRP